MSKSWQRKLSKVNHVPAEEIVLLIKDVLNVCDSIEVLDHVHFESKDTAEDWAYVFQRIGLPCHMEKFDPTTMFFDARVTRDLKSELADFIKQLLLPWAVELQEYAKKSLPRYSSGSAPLLHVLEVSDLFPELLPSYGLEGGQTVVSFSRGFRSNGLDAVSSVLRFCKKYRSVRSLARSISNKEKQRKASRDAKLPERVRSQCEKYNSPSYCTYKPLTAADWCDVDIKDIIYFSSGRKCFDMKELFSHFETGLAKKNGGRPNPQPPTDPFNREPFEKDQLKSLHFRSKVANLNIEKHQPITAKFLKLLEAGKIPQAQSSSYTPEEKLVVIAQLGL